MNLAELSRTARLFLVAVVGLRNLRDGLAVGYLRREILDIHLVLRREAALQDIEMVLALTLYDGLLQLLRVLDQNRRVLILGIVEQLAQLLLVALLLGLDGGTVAGLREDYRLDGNHGRRCRQSIVRARTLQLDRTPYVARRELRHLDAVLARNGEELRKLLLVARAAVDKLRALGDLAADDAEVRYLAYMLLELALEYECHGRLRLVRRQLLALRREELGRRLRARGDVDDELHESLGADIAPRAAAEDRHHVTLRNAQLQSRAYVVLRQHALLEIELHQGVVVDRRRLRKLLVEGAGALHLLGRDVELLTRAVLVGEVVHLHHQHVDERRESRPLAYRVLYDHRLHGRGGAYAIQHGLVIGLVAVELVDNADYGFVQYAGIARLYLVTDLPAVLRVHNHHAHIPNLEGREEAAAEVVRTRTVYDVELAAHELREEDSRIDRAFVFVLDIRIVRERVVRLDTTPAVDNLTLIGHRLGKGSLTRARRSDEYDVLDLFG